MVKFFKKYHKWLGIVLTIFILFFCISGIILNHRHTFSSVDVNRKYLSEDYHYINWNNAAVNGTEKINNDSILIYGNIGIWKTDSLFKNFTEFNTGFPKGIDNKKISKVFYNKRGDLFAGTLFGLYRYEFSDRKWVKINLPLEEQRVTDIIEKRDTLIVLTRSELLKTTDYKNFSITILPPPENYDNKVSLFKTLWIIHSGEIWGLPGKLIIDLVAMIFIFLCITGLIYFIAPSFIKRKVRKNKNSKKIKKVNKWSFKWHNKIGWITVVLLILTTITGMFLRPPLLIPIANKKVSKIPFTTLNTDNAWYDKLRRIIYLPEFNGYLIATNQGIYYSDENFNSELKYFAVQPPISIMGANVFQKTERNTILVGSFEGLFEWNFRTGFIIDYITKQKYKKPVRRGPPIGRHMATAYMNHSHGKEFYFDYNSGAHSLNDNSALKMPDDIKNQRMSLWNVALEFHTTRIYQSIIGNFYILLIPLFGLCILFILVSGFIVWFKRHRKKRKHISSPD